MELAESQSTKNNEIHLEVVIILQFLLLNCDRSCEELK